MSKNGNIKGIVSKFLKTKEIRLIYRSLTE